MRTLHLVPDYFNTDLYRQFFASLRDCCSVRVYAMDNTLRATDESDVYCAPRAFNALERLLFFPKQRALLNDICRRDICSDVDLIHAHTLFSSGNVAYNLYRKYGIPYVVAVRNTDLNVFFRHMVHLRHLGRKIARHAQKIIFISPAYQHAVCGKYLDETCEQKTIVIPNGVNDLFLADAPVRRHPATPLRLLFIGQIAAHKNIDTTLRVADKLVSRGHDVRLTLVGELRDERYRALIEQRNYCRLLPKCGPEDVIRHLRDNDIFIMPSHAETFGLVYAEAISQGMPVIYTRGQGFDGHLADGEVGYAVPDNDVEYITNRINDILADYDAMSARCVDAAQRFNWHALARQYSLIYSQAIDTAK